MKKVKILIVAGEASADLHASHVLAKLAERFSLELLGIGGDRLVAQGLDPIRHAKDMAVVGFTEAIKKIPQTVSLLKELAQIAETEKPDLALLLDLPDFNLRLAARLKAKGVPVIYYISPQVWAWRSSRVKQMAKNLDLLLSILPFEKPWYAANAPKELRVEYVGHPVIEEIPDFAYEPEKNNLVIMPGSRESEWRNLAAPMLQAAALLARSNSDLRFTLPVAEPLRDNEFVKNCLSPVGDLGECIRSLGDSLAVSHAPAHESLRKARAAWIASGTATLEAAIVGTPMVVVYKVSPTTAFLFKHLVRYQGPIAMVNLIHAGLGSQERVVPEILQDQVEPFGLASAMRDLLLDEPWKKQQEILAKTRSLLSGAGKPVENAAQAIGKFIEERL